MKILYYSDDYNWDVCSTKISLKNELESRGIDVIYRSVHECGNNTIDFRNIISQVYNDDPVDFVFIVNSGHTFLNCDMPMIRDRGVPIVAFGLSDPFSFKEKRFDTCDYYITSSMTIYDKYIHEFPVLWWPPSCDTNFHKQINYRKDIDVLFYGIGTNQALEPRDYRRKFVCELSEEIPELNFQVFGNGWGDDIKPLRGQDLITTINRAKIGIDITQVGAPITRRLFEMQACGTPVITRDSDEIRCLFGGHIGTYTNVNDLAEKLKRLVNDDMLRVALAYACKQYTIDLHNIKIRTDTLFNFLRGKSWQ